MNIPKMVLLFPAILLALALQATAGDSSSESRHTTVSTRSHTTWDDRPRGVRVLGYPFVFLGRAGETFLHFPQIISETMEGDRALVNRRGVLGPREIPVEERIISPND